MSANKTGLLGAILAICAVFLAPAAAQNTTPASVTFDIATWITNNFSGGGVDIIDLNANPQAAGTDGVNDVTITVTEYEYGDATVGGTGPSVSSASGGSTNYDSAYLNICVEFAPWMTVNAADLNDFSLSSANGGSVEYEFGAIELVPVGSSPIISDALLQTYDPQNYPGSGGTDALLHDLTTSAQEEGIAWYANEAVTTTDDFVNYTSATGVGSADQHYGSDAVGPDVWNFYSSATTQMEDIGKISFWYGIFDVNPNSSSSPGGSYNSASSSVNILVPEPNAMAMIGFAMVCLMGFRRRG